MYAIKAASAPFGGPGMAQKGRLVALFGPNVRFDRAPSCRPTGPQPRIKPGRAAVQDRTAIGEPFDWNPQAFFLES